MDTAVTLLNNLTVLASSPEALYLKLTLCSNNHPLHVKIAFSRSSCLRIFCHVQSIHWPKGIVNTYVDRSGPLESKQLHHVFAKSFGFTPSPFLDGLRHIGANWLRSVDQGLGDWKWFLKHRIQRDQSIYIYIYIYLFIHLFIYLFYLVYLFIYSRERLRRVLRKKAAVILHLHSFTSADLHLHTLTSADLHLHTFTSADLHLHTLTSADLHLHTLTSADLHLHTLTPADLHLHTLTSADLHLHTLTPADLHLHTLTPADLDLHTLTSADLHLHTLTSADLHLHTLTSADLHPHTLTPADLHLHTLTSADLHLHTFTSADLLSLFFLFSLKAGAVPPERHETQPFRTKWTLDVKN